MILSLSYGHAVFKDKALVILAYGSAPLKRLEQELRKDNKVIDATNGKKTKSVVILTTGHMVLSAIDATTLQGRCK